MDYKNFIQRKEFKSYSTGFVVKRDQLNRNMFEYQKDITKWSLKKGKSAIWAGCGLGKSLMQLEFANQVYMETMGRILILTPLSVAEQLKSEGEKFGIKARVCRSQKEVDFGINITNYEMMEHFDFSRFDGVILDESSILKSFTGKYSKDLINFCKNIPFRLSCTATPAPNDYMEIGTQAEWLGVMTRSEMLATFFVHDGGDTAKWRLKKHAESKFWEWVATWAVVLQKPSDLGYSDEGFVLPSLNVHEIVVECPRDEEEEGQISLFADVGKTLQDRRKARKNSLEIKCQKAAELANNHPKQTIIWCELNSESELLKKLIDGSVEVKGSDKPEFKVKAIQGFTNNEFKRIISKASITGFGVNWQNCSNMIFVGFSDSFEQIYQAIRRCWRFGQQNEVNVTFITSEGEGAIKENYLRKELDYEKMIAEMIKYTKKILKEEIHGTIKESIKYEPKEQIKLPEWLVG